MPKQKKNDEHNKLKQNSQTVHKIWRVWYKESAVWRIPGFVEQVTSLPPLHNVRVMVIVWRLRGNIIRTALCWIVSHNVHSQQHTYVSSSYMSNRLGLSYWNPYAVRWGGRCNMVEWFWCDSSLISMTNWFPSVLWHCWFGHLACKNRLRNDLLCVEWDVKPYTLTHSLEQVSFQHAKED